MSKTRETGLWNWLKKAKLHYKQDLGIDRIENSVGKSFPDVEGKLKHSGNFKIELKTSARPTDPLIKVKVKFQDGQPEWHRKRTSVGDNVFVLVQVGSASKARRYLIPGVFSHRLQTGVREAQMEEWSVCPPVCLPEEIIQIAAAYEAN